MGGGPAMSALPPRIHGDEVYISALLTRARLPDATQVALAQKLIESKSRALNLASFTDRYQTALLGLIKAKVGGAEPVLVARKEVGRVINLMDALRQSVAETEQKSQPVRKNGRKKMAQAA